jgi:hypothetical protein
MGLIKEQSGFAVLSDILGDEDHLGDMDFKVAGTEKGVTALQMDIKITSITAEIMQIALNQAKDGRMHILGEMAKALTGAREAVSQNAPRITVINIPKDKIREVIGSGGKVIREICEVTGAKIDIEDDGTIKVAAVDANAAKAAIDWIRGIVAEPGQRKIDRDNVMAATNEIALGPTPTPRPVPDAVNQHQRPHRTSPHARGDEQPHANHPRRPAFRPREHRLVRSCRGGTAQSGASAPGQLARRSASVLMRSSDARTVASHLVATWSAHQRPSPQKSAPSSPVYSSRVPPCSGWSVNRSTT